MTFQSYGDGLKTAPRGVLIAFNLGEKLAWRCCLSVYNPKENRSTKPWTVILNCRRNKARFLLAAYRCEFWRQAYAKFWLEVFSFGRLLIFHLVDESWAMEGHKCQSGMSLV